MYEELLAQHGDATYGKHAAGRPNSVSVSDITERIDKENERDRNRQKRYEDALAAFDKAFDKFSDKSEDKSDVVDTPKVPATDDETNPVEEILHDPSLSSEEREAKLQKLRSNEDLEKWRQSVLDKRSDGHTSPEDIEAELRAGPEGTHEKSPKEIFRAVLDQELGKLVESGLLPQEQADIKKQKADEIHESEFKDKPVQQAIEFARAGTKWDRDRIRTVETTETDKPSVEETSQTLDELADAFDQLNDSDTAAEADHNLDELDDATGQLYDGDAGDEESRAKESWADHDTREMPVITLEDDELPAEGRKNWITKIREARSVAQARKANRTAGKLSLREQLSRNKEYNFLGEPRRVGYSLNEFFRKRYEKRYRKLTQASKHAVEHSDE